MFLQRGHYASFCKEVPVLKLDRIRELNLSGHSAITAASGLVRYNDMYYVVADNELHLARFSSTSSDVGERIRIFDGTLSNDPKERKKQKPDLEALCFLPASIAGEDSLLLIPSGSTKMRNRGALVSLAEGSVKELSFTELYGALEKTFPNLNIEGAVIVGKTLWLFQRGNADPNQNAIICLDLARLRPQLATLHLTADLVTKTFCVPLSSPHGVSYGFTDATTDEHTVWFLACAEATANTYDDGEFHGAILGKMDFSGKVLETYELDSQEKPEGLALHEKHFFIVTDADDPSIPSRLLRGNLP